MNFKTGILKIEIPVSPGITFIEHNLFVSLLSANQND